MADAGIGVYFRIWLGLLALLAFNVVLAFLVPGLFGPWLHPGIAAIQAGLMMAVFMSLRSGGVLLKLVAMAGFFWLFLLFALTFGDYETRFEDVAMGRQVYLQPEPGLTAPSTATSPVAAGSLVPPATPKPAFQATPEQEAGTQPLNFAQGERLFNITCSGCHRSGILGAPKLGDKADWGARFKQGLKTLVSHAVNGFRGMPPKGGKPALTESEIQNTIAYMLTESGIGLDRK